MNLGYKGFRFGLLKDERSLYSAKLLVHLKSRILSMGGHIGTGRATLRASGGRISAAIVNGREFHAEKYVVAAGAWSNEVCKPLGYDPLILPARGLVLYCKTGGSKLVDYPAHYDEGLTVTQHDSDTLRLTSFFELVGFEPRFNRSRVDWLFRTAVSHFSRSSDVRVSELGVGFRPSTPDQLPAVGKVPRCDNGYLLSGSCRKGMALAPILGKMLMKEMLGSDDVPDPLARALDPGRFLAI